MNTNEKDMNSDISAFIRLICVNLRFLCLMPGALTRVVTP